MTKLSIQIAGPHVCICVFLIKEAFQVPIMRKQQHTVVFITLLRVICHLRAVENQEVSNTQHSDENTCSPAALTFMLIVWSHLWSNRNYWSKQFTGKHFCVLNTSSHAMCVKHPMVLYNYSYRNDFIISIHNLSTHILSPRVWFQQPTLPHNLIKYLIWIAV